MTNNETATWVDRVSEQYFQHLMGKRLRVLHAVEFGRAVWVEGLVVGVLPDRSVELDGGEVGARIRVPYSQVSTALRQAQ